MSDLMQPAPGRWPEPAAVRVRVLAEAQEGVVSRAQLLASGVSSARIGRWVARGWLLRLHPGVYALGHRAISPRGMKLAGLLYAGERSALSHRTGLHHWELINEAPPVIHVSVPVQRPNVRGIITHTPRAVLATEHDGLRVTTVARTLMDSAPSTPDWQLRKALAEAEYQGLLAAEDLSRVMGRGQPGSARLRRAIERHMPELARTLSPLEDRFFLLCERHGISLPEPNVRIGPFVVDAFWRAERLIIELDGAAAHSSPDQRRRDEARAEALRQLGYTLLRFTWHDVVRTPGAVAATVRSTLQAAN